MIAHSLKWTRHNLFGKPFDAILSLTVLPLLLWAAYESLSWALETAQWGVIPQSLRVLMIGVFPADQAWRAWTAVIILCGLLGASLGYIFAFRGNHALVLGILAAAVVAIGAASGAYGATAGTLACIAATALAWLVVTNIEAAGKCVGAASLIGFVAVIAVMAPPGVGLWGGLLLTVLLTLVTAVVSLPIGILLAFGRRSKLSSIRIICTAYIEIMRSVPLILVVYWIWILTPVLVPQWGLPDVARGIIGFTLFYSAYVAEYVRTGLQAVPRGQTEAGRSLGMSEFDVNRTVVLPQAIRVVVPPLVGNVLDIFNAAPLVFIIGLTDFLRAGQMILANPENGDKTQEVLLFLLVTYFAVGSLITFVARRLEAHLAKGSR